MMKSHLTDVAFFEKHMIDKGKLALSSIYIYTKSVERFLATDPNLEELNDYNNFLIELSWKKRCSHYYSAIKAFIEFKITDANLRNRLIDGLIKPKEWKSPLRKRQYLEEEKIIEVVNNLSTQKHRTIALIQTITGVRSGDVFRLKYGDIIPEEYENKPVLRLNVVGKGQKLNVVYIHDIVAQGLIMEYVTNNMGVNDYYFLNLGNLKGREGQADNEFKLTNMNYLWYWTDLKQALQTANIDKTQFATHDFRRSFSRRAWTQSKDIYRLQSLLGHRDPKTTLKYLEQSGLKNIDFHREMQT